MDILFVSEYFYPRLAGGEITSWQVCAALADRGHKMYVVTSRLEDTAEHEVANGIEIFRPLFSAGLRSQKGILNSNAMIRRTIFAVRLYYYLKQFLECHPVDVIYNVAYIPSIPATWLASRNHIATLTAIHSLCGKTWFQLTNPILALVNYLMEILVIRLGQHNVIHCPSREVTERVQRYSKAKVITIANPLDLNEINRVTSNTNTKLIRRNIDIKEGEQFLLFVGSLYPIKNASNLVTALNRLNTNFKLVLVGEGPERPKIEKLVKELNLEGKVVLLGQKPHKETLGIMKSCDILIMPSKTEAFALVVLEALALGKPVIATPVGCIPEIKSKNLYLVDNIEGVNRLLEKGIKPKEDRGIVEEYSMDRIIEQFEYLFQSIIKWKSQI